ncbi:MULTISPECIES: hypothetical protein [Nostoc]|uniref:Uncharacterized protein n=1 Tax=Nostoc paludosum FACHB-159 TaxID=2692908 RepID=A0ABR8KGC3_9NOSO|nr:MULTISPECIES: hypothetical protein [Nostoc]MBD2681290.1 hypothetical protein [Nostoc sp. FACHB-857]MBD2737769.1 hypothetical protein [Nostoc paludosum FACHB-159]
MKNTNTIFKNEIPKLEDYINNPWLLKQLSDRVYEIFLEDMHHQQERITNYCRERRL